MTEYQEFLKTKREINFDSGFRIKETTINPMLFPFQKTIVKWALKRGKAAIFADCGLGKTPIQLEWGKHVNRKTNKPILIFAPLAVSKQTKREGDKFGIPVNICREQGDIINGINITNYEMLHHFEPDNLAGVVLDESSILKGYDGKFRQSITNFAQSILYKLACTATPAPNDHIELINHAEFFGIMSAKEILGLFFIQDGNVSHKWRLKNHATKDFWEWIASWSVALRMPSDLGFDNDGFVLPKLKIEQITTKTTEKDVLPGKLLAIEASTLRERQISRMNSTEDRVRICADMINNSDEQWLVWCDLNRESNLLTKSINDAVEVKGADAIEHKEQALLAFSDGSIRVLVTKPSIAGFGLNLQRCHNMAFVGLSDSYEKLYQATRRCWRFGQKKEVNSYIITSEMEGAVVRNIKRKEEEATKLFDEVIKHMNLSGQVGATKREEMVYMEDHQIGKNWEMYLGDSITQIDKIKNDSIGLSVFSPPFPGMYVYGNSKKDIGNTKTIQELIKHFSFLMPKLLRITMPGRHCCIHLCQTVAFKSKDGYIGIKDFRGNVISTMEQFGWVYYGEVCIDKDPQVKAIRTKDRGLLFKTLSKDAAHLHPGLADYLLQFRKPGDNPKPIQAGISQKYKTNGWITAEEWIEWAAPVWYRKTKNYPGGIRETDVLNVKQARDHKDERHLCPLQLGVIERAIKLWSNPGDIIYSPFAGIGSEGYVALRLSRKFIGCELKKSYFDEAVRNLKSVKTIGIMQNLFQG